MLIQLSTAGILEFWIQKYADMRYFTMKNVPEEQKRMELHHLYGIFNIWLMGLAVSLIIFVAELVRPFTKKAFEKK